MDAGKKPHILIVGAGLGGLALAQALRKQSVSCEIFERSTEGRAQGYAIGIHSIVGDLGAAFPDDLPPMEVVDHLLPYSLPAQIIFYPPDALEPRIGVEDSGDRSIIRANRQRLRDWLATGIDVQHGKTAVSVDQSEDSVTVHFKDGSSATGDFLVGADGAHSAIRKSLLSSVGTEDPLQHLPLVMITGELKLEVADMERQMELGHSCYVAGYHNTGNLFVGLNAVSNDGKTGDYYWAVVYSDEGARERDHWTKTATKEKLFEFARDKIAHLHPRFLEIVDKTSAQGMVVPTLTLQDIELDSLPVGRVTLLGDSAHCMTPFRGEGGIHAMRDALNLAKIMSASKNAGLDQWKKSFAEYQAEMLERGVKSVQLSRGTGNQAAAAKEGPRYGWGHPAGEIPARTISLKDVPLVKPS